MSEIDDGLGKQKPSLFADYILPGFIISLAIGIVAMFYVIRQKPPEAERIDMTPVVITTAATPAPSSFEILTNGTVVPKREIIAAAEVAGKIILKSENCDAGRFVKQGELLVEIDPSKYELQLQQLENELRQVEIDAAEMAIEQDKNMSLIAIGEEDLALAQRELDRWKSS